MASQRYYWISALWETLPETSGFVSRPLWPSVPVYDLNSANENARLQYEALGKVEKSAAQLCLASLIDERDWSASHGNI
jgi:hypothetical protein